VNSIPVDDGVALSINNTFPDEVQRVLESHDALVSSIQPSTIR
jgi:hypothetical protein